MPESPHHWELKRLAFLWARESGYRACATEVSLPKCHFRADIAACLPAERGSAEPGITAVFECKFFRSDLLRDNAEAASARAALRELQARRAELEKLLRVHHPSLSNGDSLFPEWTSYSLESASHEGYQAVLRDIKTHQRKLQLRTKFEKLTRYRCANLCYLVVEDGICDPDEAPLGWGILVKTGGRLSLETKPVWHDSDAATRLALLQRIASAGSRMLAVHFGEARLDEEGAFKEPDEESFPAAEEAEV